MVLVPEGNCLPECIVGCGRPAPRIAGGDHGQLDTGGRLRIFAGGGPARAGRLDVAVMAGLMAVKPQVSDALAVQAAHGDLAFWELDPAELKDLDLRGSDLGPPERPGAASRLEGLHQAW